jgi:capsid protein
VSLTTRIVGAWKQLRGVTVPERALAMPTATEIAATPIPAEIQAAYNGFAGSAHNGARMTSLLGGWSSFLGDPDTNYAWDAETLAARAWELIENDGHCRAMLEAVILKTFGSQGLRFKSLYQDDDAKHTTDGARERRRKITCAVATASAGTRLDAGGQLTRRKMETQFLVDKVATGDGYMVRQWMPNRVNAYQAGCWRRVAWERVCNPDNQADSDRLWQGMEYDADGVWCAIHVRNRSPYAQTISGERPYWTRVPLTGPDGTRCVLHGFKAIRGERRGYSWFAPLLVLAKHLQQTVAAYVIAKRVQACHPLIIKVPDAQLAAMKARQEAVLGPNTKIEPGRIYYTSETADIFAPNWTFNGADFRDFIDSQLRVFTAVWQMPFQVVLQQLTDANMASSRAALDQAELTGERFQQDQVDECTHPINEGIIREDVTRKRLVVVPGDWDRICRGSYSGPRRWSTDKVKDATAAETLIGIGVSRSTAFSDLGLDYMEELALVAEEKTFAEAQGIEIAPLPTAPAKPAPAAEPDPTDPIDPADDAAPAPAELVPA